MLALQPITCPGYFIIIIYFPADCRLFFTVLSPVDCVLVNLQSTYFQHLDYLPFLLKCLLQISCLFTFPLSSVGKLFIDGWYSVLEVLCCMLLYGSLTTAAMHSLCYVSHDHITYFTSSALLYRFKSSLIWEFSFSSIIRITTDA